MLSSLFVLLAQQIELQPTGEFAPLLDITIPSMISTGIRIVLIVAALIFFIVLLIGGIQWMTSGGDKAATEAARGKITAALIGLVIVFAGWAIIALIKTLWGVDILRLEIPSFQP